MFSLCRGSGAMWTHRYRAGTHVERGPCSTAYLAVAGKAGYRQYW